MDRIKCLAIAFLLAFACASIVGADGPALERYIAGFDRQAQQEMKIDSAALVAGTKGFQVKYLNDGLTGLARYLRENNIRL